MSGPRRVLILPVAACVLVGTWLLACGPARFAARADAAATELLATTGACAVQEVRYLAEGGDQSWSDQHDLLAYDQMDGAGVSQLHLMRPDGSDDRCLTCTSQQPGAPRTDRHKFNPEWHPSGSHIVLVGEMDKHPLSWLREFKTSELFANGLWSNLYAITPDGQRWYRLTDYDNVKEDGPLLPRFSPDGSKLLWSRLVEKGTQGSGERPFGRWRLQLADFVVDGAGAPSLQNVRDITPAGAVFVEPHGFSPDGSRIIFTSDIENTHAWGMDIWTMVLATGAVENLTRSPYWEEHASYAPSGQKISFMSSEPYPGVVLQTELLLANADGTDPRLLTRFNVAGAPEKTAEKSMPLHNRWSADGSRLAITLQYGGLSYPKRQLYMLTFAGTCGG